MARYLALPRYESLSDFEKKIDRLFPFQPASSRGLARCCGAWLHAYKLIKDSNAQVFMYIARYLALPCVIGRKLPTESEPVTPLYR